MAKKSKIKNKITIIIAIFSLSVMLILLVIFSQFSTVAGYSNSINKAGSERMRTILLGYQGTSFINALRLKKNSDASKIKKEINETIVVYEEILIGLVDGDGKHGLEATVDQEILQAIEVWNKEWIKFKIQLINITLQTSYTSNLEHLQTNISLDKSTAIKDLVNDVVLLYTAKSNNSNNSIKIFLMLIIIFVILVSVFIIVQVSRSLSPIGGILGNIKNIANGDLTQNINHKINNEIGEIADSLNKMGNTFNDLIGDIGESTHKVKAADDDLSLALIKTQSNVVEIVGHITNMDNNLEIQANSITKSSIAVNSLQEQTESMKTSMESQNASIAENSASIEEMVSSIESVSRNTEKASDISGNLLVTAADGGKQIHKALVSIKEIEEESKKIINAVSGIADIAAVTNLLSMNAAIEAAHAGVAGKGFAVVAQEIGKLAVNADSETKKIIDIVNSTSNKISESSSLAAEAEQAFNIILNNIQISADLSKEIAKSLEEQSIASKDILQNTSEIVEVSNDVTAILEKANIESESVENAINELTQMKDAISNISLKLKERGASIERAVKVSTGVSKENSLIVETLEKKISQFKTSKS